MKFRFLILLIVAFVAASLAASEATRIILFTIDGLHWEAPAKLNMPVFNALKEEGTYVRKSYMIIPHHPTVGDYSKFNSCSFPNPVLHQGSLFISPDNRMLQEIVSLHFPTAFVVNTTAYRSVARVLQRPLWIPASPTIKWSITPLPCSNNRMSDLCGSIFNLLEQWESLWHYTVRINHTTTIFGQMVHPTLTQ